ncbi:UDP-xylose and UDP-N-acetylglucosamine transporter [Nymphon striatum]|nr:UDP-xylose and UDP-N-acetylglucosamine transporter [Nymphon striatum]
MATEIIPNMVFGYALCISKHKKNHPGSGNIITFAQFIFVSIHGFMFYSKFGRKKPAIPLRFYVTMVVIYFGVSVTNNYALNFKIALPLHMIFRSGSLLANMVLGIVMLKKRYKLSKYISVFMITIGIIVCTIASAKDINNPDEKSQDGDVFTDYLIWIFGLSMLTFALLMSARLGIYQETLYAKHGKHADEALFYCHTLPLPGFLLMAGDIYHHANLFSQSVPVLIPIFGIGVPKMWLFLLGNVITQYVCIRGVYTLTTECSSLTVTLVITLRKFFSLMFSIYYFQNPFSVYHWIGTFLVFSGTLLFTEVFNKLRVQKDEKDK